MENRTNRRENHDFHRKIHGKSRNSQRPPTFVLSTCPWPTAPGAPRAPHRPQGGTAATPAAPQGDARGRRAKGRAQVGPWEFRGVSMGKWWKMWWNFNILTMMFNFMSWIGQNRFWGSRFGIPSIIIDHHLPFKLKGFVKKPTSMNQATNGKRTSMGF